MLLSPTNMVPTGSVMNPAAITAMKERGIDISGEFPKPWTDETVHAADVVITMGLRRRLPVFPGKAYEEWVLDDPAGLDIAAVRVLREEIERRVRALLKRTCSTDLLLRAREAP